MWIYLLYVVGHKYTGHEKILYGSGFGQLCKWKFKWMDVITWTQVKVVGQLPLVASWPTPKRGLSRKFNGTANITLSAEATPFQTTNWFSKRGWSQHSKTAFKVFDKNVRAIKLPKFNFWPTGYRISTSWYFTCFFLRTFQCVNQHVIYNLPCRR